jgi:hypothetical protein
MSSELGERSRITQRHIASEFNFQWWLVRNILREIKIQLMLYIKTSTNFTLCSSIKASSAETDKIQCNLLKKIHVSHSEWRREEVQNEALENRSIFWDMTPCNPTKVNPCFGVTYHLHLQGRRISLLRASFLRFLFFRPEDGSDMFRRNVDWFARLHGVIFQKIRFFMVSVARTSNP